jgi:hypothetical protein
MRPVGAGAVYFGVVFGAGFVLGLVRELWLVSRLGERTAELLEVPVMLAVIVVGARWVVRRFAVPPASASRLAVGATGLALLVLVEFGGVLWLRGLTLREYVASRDAVAGTVYVLMLGVFMVMPLLVGRYSPHQRRASST